MPETRPGPPTQIIAGRQAWLRTLETEYQPVATRLQRAYEQTARRLEPYRTALVDELVRQAEAGIEITPEMVRGMRQWSILLAQTEIEMGNFARLAEADMSLGADTAVQIGAEAARQLTLATLNDYVRPVIDAGFIRPDPEAIRRLIGYADGTAMQQRVATFGQDAVKSFADVMLTGFAQGKHPVTMARAMSNWLAMPYAWAENMTRTTYLYSYRGASHVTYAANDRLLDGWVWWSARDGRTCWSCFDRHGQIYRTDETLNDHHRGRCTPVPLVIGTTWAQDMLSGADEFAQLPEADQRQILGPALYETYRAGQLPWGELSRPYHNDVFGEMLRAATVGEVLRKVS